MDAGSGLIPWPVMTADPGECGSSGRDRSRASAVDLRLLRAAVEASGEAIVITSADLDEPGRCRGSLRRPDSSRDRVGRARSSLPRGLHADSGRRTGRGRSRPSKDQRTRRLRRLSGSLPRQQPTKTPTQRDRRRTRVAAKRGSTPALLPFVLTGRAPRLCMGDIGERSPDEAPAEESRPICTRCKDASCLRLTPSPSKNSRA
jgi:hypothetical protein